MTNHPKIAGQPGRISAPSQFEAPADTIRRAQLNIAGATLRKVITRQDAIIVLQALGLDNPKVNESTNSNRPLLSPRALL